ncbi:TPA: hypothetical protein QDC25_003734 [Burkholderia aenigmatica]|nr:hypothetical protein [Burkholderia aenigmatica]HDR9593174.1 hypothetical protein [Burkholderia aenigmatica]HDR9641727.1 hypothetical protein [Burkholderia aenigmatica]HDR9688297.1 hypothetical protein [Burkholderia aenigmatica]
MSTLPAFALLVVVPTMPDVCEGVMAPVAVSVVTVLPNDGLVEGPFEIRKPPDDPGEMNVNPVELPIATSYCVTPVRTAADGPPQAGALDAPVETIA